MDPKRWDLTLMASSGASRACTSSTVPLGALGPVEPPRPSARELRIAPELQVVLGVVALLPQLVSKALLQLQVVPRPLLQLEVVPRLLRQAVACLPRAPQFATKSMR